MHFFNPVGRSELVELIRGDATDDETLKAAEEIHPASGKREQSSYVTLRALPRVASGSCLAWRRFAWSKEGVCDPAGIDLAMELGYKHAMGPLRTTDLVGLDVRLAVAEELSSTLGPRFTPPQLLRDMVADGHLGRKTGQGFYKWPVSP